MLVAGNIPISLRAYGDSNSRNIVKVVPELQKLTEDQRKKILLITNEPGEELIKDVAEELNIKYRVLITKKFADGDYKHELNLQPEDTEQTKTIVFLGDRKDNMPLVQVEALQVAKKLSTMGREDTDFYFSYYPGARETKMVKAGNIETGPQLLGMIRDVGIRGRVVALGLHDKVKINLNKNIQDISERARMATEGLVKSRIDVYLKKEFISGAKSLSEAKTEELTNELAKFEVALREVGRDVYLKHLLEKNGKDYAYLVEEGFLTKEDMATYKEVIERCRGIELVNGNKMWSELRLADMKGRLLALSKDLKAVQTVYEKVEGSIQEQTVENRSLRGLQLAAVRNYLQEKGIPIEKVGGCGPDYSEYVKGLIPFMQDLTGIDDIERLPIGWSDKYRPVDSTDETEVVDVHGIEKLYGKHVLIGDDIFGTGGTVKKTLLKLWEHKFEDPNTEKQPLSVNIMIDHPHISLEQVVRDVEEVREVKVDGEMREKVYVREERTYKALNNIISWRKEGLIDKMFISNSISWFTKMAQEVNASFEAQGEEPLFIISSVAPVLVSSINGEADTVRGER